jgi:hypothetical protein
MEAFNKIEECACCGKDVKRPVKFRGMFVGKDCRDTARAIQMRSWGMGGREGAIESARRDWPRRADALIALAGI